MDEKELIMLPIQDWLINSKPCTKDNIVFATGVGINATICTGTVDEFVDDNVDIAVKRIFVNYLVEYINHCNKTDVDWLEGINLDLSNIILGGFIDDGTEEKTGIYYILLPEEHCHIVTDVVPPENFGDKKIIIKVVLDNFKPLKDNTYLLDALTDPVFAKALNEGMMISTNSEVVDPMQYWSIYQINDPNDKVDTAEDDKLTPFFKNVIMDYFINRGLIGHADLMDHVDNITTGEIERNGIMIRLLGIRFSILGRKYNVNTAISFDVSEEEETE